LGLELAGAGFGGEGEKVASSEVWEGKPGPQVPDALGARGQAGLHPIACDAPPSGARPLPHPQAIFLGAAGVSFLATLAFLAFVPSHPNNETEAARQRRQQQQQQQEEKEDAEPSRPGLRQQARALWRDVSCMGADFYRTLAVIGLYGLGHINESLLEARAIEVGWIAAYGRCGGGRVLQIFWLLGGPQVPGYGALFRPKVSGLRLCACCGCRPCQCLAGRGIGRRKPEQPEADPRLKFMRPPAPHALAPTRAALRSPRTAALAPTPLWHDPSAGRLWQGRGDAGGRAAVPQRQRVRVPPWAPRRQARPQVRRPPRAGAGLAVVIPGAGAGLAVVIPGAGAGLAVVIPGPQGAGAQQHSQLAPPRGCRSALLCSQMQAARAMGEGPADQLAPRDPPSRAPAPAARADSAARDAPGCCWRPRRTTFALGMAALIAGDLVLLASGAWPPAVFVACVLWGAHWAVVQGPMLGVVVGLAPPHLKGTAFGIFYSLMALTAVVANTVFGSVWHAAGAPAAFGLSACIISLTLCFALPRLLPPRPPPRGGGGAAAPAPGPAPAAAPAA
jgi:hypothetical protein